MPRPSCPARRPTYRRGGRADLPTDWRYSIIRRLTELTAAWRVPEAWQGQTRAGGIEMSAQQAGFVVNNELVLHGWDLAVATEQPFVVAAENLEASWQFVVNTPDDPAAREGLFGPRLPIPNDAPLLDRTLAYAGGNPLGRLVIAERCMRSRVGERR
jgi:uncharacterized protein (TIGR03086 family)